MTKDIACYQPQCKEKNWTKLVFDVDALWHLYTSAALLNDDVMNGCAALLSDAFLESSTVLFSMYDLAALRNQSESETIWRYTHKLKFWMYTQWVIPIHHKHQVHWTVATVNLTTKDLELFDSLTDALESERDIQDVLRFIRMITTCARKQGYKLPPSSMASWTMTRLIAMPIQHNGYDCGIWVLLQICANPLSLYSLSTRNMEFNVRINFAMASISAIDLKRSNISNTPIYQMALTYKRI
ncbi:uncharacterized protein EV420DRAFT_1726811 [Desarmillaria tabescens]|uniref:Ubiquitin-like protease family profile domain-containing protein n=1 Tax=Armillaria tabescens TaxID=1929756 RepID=A0AA39JHJ5_ARMTA|nr:uncharacterized protein EV420DRAFT_1726811 [Desarmillaria tabescens]KAK0442763.1 hypothetical protein EV420DRAFT_1726811 [Desarmillaria tabescens]